MARPLRAPRRLRSLTAALAAALALAWLGGFIWFVGRASAPSPLPPHADGVVALTGGADRIPAALRLLQEGRAERLLISGVGPEVTEAHLSRLAGVDLAAFGDRVTIGHEATTTEGNAEETAHWAQAHGVRSLIVVTAAYHMERALTEIGRVLPDARLYPMPVRPPALRAGGIGALRLLLAEYTKFLAATLGLTKLEAGWRSDTT